jgi:hypothetical protein
VATIEVIAPNRLHGYWSFVRRGLEDIIAKTKPEWIPEDAYSRLSHGEAALYVVSQNAIPLGFAVCYLQPRNYGLKQDLCIWQGWSLPMQTLHDLGVSPSDATRIIEDLFDYLKKVAEHSKAASLTFYSPRKGMQRASAKWGFAPVLTQYSCSV